ncbi:hypothetical protein E4634_06875 [Mangrovimicrobium sediminis]|uniref:Uncharacterized protein n=1 Tax=Mangrovimicrobium sediminis TaxID=2562682 RepID=A0A4Z0M341_9GAMM|nr:hypothetical protein [Haliea sp. SAOS-164]TGD73860.1 hypothetical protein E4634_06875 [Haliea sp. SAOS-164]
MGERARFEARDLGFEQPSCGTGTPRYIGIERRHMTRRVRADRRMDVRFEPGKQDRRKNNGRRAEDRMPKFW